MRIKFSCFIGKETEESLDDSSIDLTPNLENLTLADWAAWYDNCSSKPYVKEPHKVDIDVLPLQKYIDDELNKMMMMMMSLSRQQTVKQGDVSKARVLRSVCFNKQEEPEKHYHELLMLFTPWRNEETDLLGNLKSYEDRCMVLSSVIKERINNLLSVMKISVKSNNK